MKFHSKYFTQKYSRSNEKLLVFQMKFICVQQIISKRQCVQMVHYFLCVLIYRDWAQLTEPQKRHESWANGNNNPVFWPNVCWAFFTLKHNRNMNFHLTLSHLRLLPMINHSSQYGRNLFVHKFSRCLPVPFKTWNGLNVRANHIKINQRWQTILKVAVCVPCNRFSINKLFKISTWACNNVIISLLFWIEKTKAFDE